ncbi:hypothetical protein L218DRAFT_1079376 [Marasmius fiardii PR-910]|nr:hypothetical protein L218DRAFT_1079376 [Marasmius fiardii PR-910]
MAEDSDCNYTLCFPRGSSTPIIVKSPKPADVPAYHVLLKMDRFGFSANNITYQAFGEHPSLRYYDFYPAPTVPSQSISSKTHGVVPVWGFATVLASSHPKVHVGERLYGYFAPTKYLLLPIDPTDVNKYALYVPRPQFPPDRRLYNQIIRTSTDPLYTPSTEDLQMIYRPLFWTSYWCEDWLFHGSPGEGYHGGCDGILISSASSKTAFCFAYCVRNRRQKETEKRGGESRRKGSGDNALKLIALTSKKNLRFTEHLGLYDEVHDYDSLSSHPSFHGDRERPQRWIYVDVTGNTSLNQQVFDHFASRSSRDKLIVSVSLGATNTTPEVASNNSTSFTEEDAKGIMGTSTSPLGLPSTGTSSDGSAPLKLERFFTPEWVAVRRRQMPLSDIFNLQKTEWHKLMKDCVQWIGIERLYGPEEVKKSYERILSGGGVQPDTGLVWSLWEEENGGGDGKAKL